MPRLLLILLCGLLCAGSGIAQKRVRYFGTVQMADKGFISYYLELELSSKTTTISGYSITGYQDGNRMKASVSGHFINPSEMYIVEMTSLDDRAANPFTQICYFSARLKLTVMMNGRQRWNGPFESHQANGLPCGGGVMTLMDQAPPLEDVPKPKPNVIRVEMPKPPPAPPRPKADTPKARPPIVVQKPKDTPKPKPAVIVQQAKPQPPPPEVPDSCQRRYDWSSPDFAFDVWDGWTIDGDVISLRMNGRQLLDRTKLSEQKQHFSVPLHSGLNVLYIYLHEEGFEPPNTPNFTLYDGDKKYELSVSGNVGEVARICVWRK